MAGILQATGIVKQFKSSLLAGLAIAKLYGLSFL